MYSSNEFQSKSTENPAGLTTESHPMKNSYTNQTITPYHVSDPCWIYWLTHSRTQVFHKPSRQKVIVAINDARAIRWRIMCLWLKPMTRFCKKKFYEAPLWQRAKGPPGSWKCNCWKRENPTRTELISNLLNQSTSKSCIIVEPLLYTKSWARKAEMGRETVSSLLRNPHSSGWVFIYRQ